MSTPLDAQALLLLQQHFDGRRGCLCRDAGDDRRIRIVRIEGKLYRITVTHWVEPTHPELSREMGFEVQDGRLTAVAHYPTEIPRRPEVTGGHATYLSEVVKAALG